MGASSFGITAERVNAILYYQRKEQEARKAGTISGERADQPLWDVVDDETKYSKRRQNSKDERGSHAKALEGTRSMRYQAAPEGVTREDIEKILKGVSAMMPATATKKTEPKQKEADPIVQSTIEADSSGAPSRFKFIFTDKKDDLPFLVRGQDGSAQVVSPTIPPAKKHRRREA